MSGTAISLGQVGISNMKVLSLFLFLFMHSLFAGVTQHLYSSKCDVAASVRFTSVEFRLDAEGTANIPFQITMTATQKCDTKVFLEFNGSAVAGVDFNPIASPIIIPAGQTVYNGTYTLLTPNSLVDRSLIINLVKTNRKKIVLGTEDQIQQWILSPAALATGYHFYKKVSTSGDSILDTAHTCGINTDGELHCWGKNSNYEIGDGTTTTRTSFVEIDVGVKYRDLSLGGAHSCAITNAGILKCWGKNDLGQLGDTTNTDRETPTIINSGTSFLMVASGKNHTCAIDMSGTLFCTGSNESGQIGAGSLFGATNILITVDSSYQLVTAGYNNSCGIKSDGELRCWGKNNRHQLGDGTTSDQSTPVVIDTGTYYSKVSLGYDHGCGITSAGVLKCFGANDFSQIGDGTTTEANTPIVIDGGTTYEDVAAGDQFTCGVTTTGDLKCWGKNDTYQMGDGGTATVTTPTLRITDAGAISAGMGTACAFKKGVGLSCWGKNDWGQVGDGTTSVVTAHSNYISPITSGTIHDFAVGAGRACAITTNKKLKCWGNHPGDGSNTYTFSIIEVDPGVTYSAIFGGDARLCGITSAGDLKCWGYSFTGAIGDGFATPRYAPVLIDAGTKYQYVGLGESHTCGITTTGVLKCWGLNSNGQIGDGGTSQQNSPVVIDAGTKYFMVSLGPTHTCGITFAGVFKCWGTNASGQLGDSTTTPSNLPIVADSGTSYRFVSASNQKTCGITTSGALKCFGLEVNSDLTTLLTPTILDVGFSYTQFYFPCGLTTTGLLRCGAQQRGYPSYQGNKRFNKNFAQLTIDIVDSYKKIKGWKEPFCGLTTTGFLKCFGRGAEGSLSNAVVGNIRLPRLMHSDVLDISPNRGGASYGCLLTKSGEVKCWGDGASPGGGTWNGTSRSNQAVAVPLQSKGTFTQISGYNNTTACGLNGAGELYCWGYNGSTGTLGDGTTISKSYAVRIDTPNRFLRVSVGGVHTCAITVTGVLKCWGENNLHQVGDGTTTPRPSPVVIDSGTSYSEVSVSGETRSSCAITTSGVLKCWGANNIYQLGTGDTTEAQTPTVIDSGVSYAKVSVNDQSCGVTTTGGLKCWGTPTSSQIGNGSATSSTPVIIDSGVNYQSISSSRLNRCGITTTGELKCWGYGGYSSNGNGTDLTLNFPTVIDSGVSYKKVFTTGGATCGITLSDELKCWGTEWGNTHPNGNTSLGPTYLPGLRQ